MEKKLIEWNDNFSVGITEIDDQHKVLVGMINDAYSAIIKGDTEIVASELIKKMYDYAEYHFNTEEKYFIKYNYEHREKHMSEHKSFLKKVMEFKREFRKGKEKLADEIFIFLKDWLIDHILLSDKKYVVIFKNK